MVDKFLIELTQLTRHISMEVSAAARAYLAEKGYDKAMGARPMARLIKEELKKELANELLFGQLNKGGIVNNGLKDDKLTFTYSKVDEKRAEPGRVNAIRYEKPCKCGLFLYLPI